MNIYLVRHGQSTSNAEKVSSSSSTGLSEIGIKQAEFLAERLKDISLDLIVSSTLDRAKSTAVIINKDKILPIEYSDLFVERKNPSGNEGKKHNDTENVNIWQIIQEHYHESEYHYSDEENFEDLKVRGLKALDYILSLNQESILIVSHAKFLKMLCCVMLWGKDLNSYEHLAIRDYTSLNNAGITLLSYNSENKRFYLKTMNDLVHLGELVTS